MQLLSRIWGGISFWFSNFEIPAVFFSTGYHRTEPLWLQEIKKKRIMYKIQEHLQLLSKFSLQLSIKKRKNLSISHPFIYPPNCLMWERRHRGSFWQIPTHPPTPLTPSHPRPCRPYMGGATALVRKSKIRKIGSKKIIQPNFENYLRIFTLC